MEPDRLRNRNSSYLIMWPLRRYCRLEVEPEGCSLKRDIAKDQVLTVGDVTFPEGRVCDRLRDEQNNHFSNK